MLKDLGLDLDLTRSKRPFKVQLALPSKVITQNILNVTTANISDVKLNSLPHFEFEIPYLVESKKNGITDEIEYIKNPDLDNIKEEKLIKLTWYSGRINWFRVVTIEKNDSSDGITAKISCDSLESELRTTNVTIEGTGIGTEEYFTKALEQSPWKLGYVSNKLKETYRTFTDQEKQTRYEAIQNGIEVYGAITDFDGETRTLNLLTIDELRIFRGVVLKKENYANSIDITSTSEEIVTRMYAKGNEDLDISSANPTGMRYIEDYSYFLHPFERDENKNVLSHSNYMSDELSHALLDLMALQKIYIPKIDETQKELDGHYKELSTALSDKADLDGEVLTIEALLDTAKATSDENLIYQRTMELRDKNIEVDKKKAQIDGLNNTITNGNKQIEDYQEIISTNSFTPKLVDELKLFVYEKDFSDDRYLDAKSLYDATVEEFEKYQKPTRSFKTDLTSFINSIESKKYHGRLEIGEEVKIKSNKLNEEYTSIIIGYSADLISGDFQLEISDNMEDIDALDRLATIIYQSESSSSILSNNKYKWNNIVEVKDEVTSWRDKEIKTVDNRITAGANESITLDNRGMMIRNPDFPNERIIIQSGVIALSKDGGETWSTSITPNGVIAETLIGKILAGNNLIITNDSGSFVIDNTGMTVNMDSIRIMSGDEGNPKNVIEFWNKLLLTYEEIASDNLVNEYEKRQLQKQWTKIVDIHSSMIASFLKGRGEPTEENPYPEEYSEYITTYEALNDYLNKTKQSDGYALLDEANITKTTTIDPDIFKKKFLDYDKAKQALESIISFDYTKSEIKVLETGISLTYVKNDGIVTALNLSEEGVRIDGKLLEINSKTEFNADLTMNAGVIRGKDDGIVIDLNTGKITLNTKVEIGTGSNIVTDDDLKPLVGEVIATLSNDMATIFTDINGSSGNYSLAVTEMTIYRNGNIDNSNWKFSVEKNDNVVMTQSENKLTVLSVKTNSEVITLVATSGKEVIKKEFKVVKYKDTNGNINRWISMADSIHKSMFDEWIPSQLTALGNQQVVGQDMTSYKGRYKVYESKDGGVNYFVKYTSSADEDILKYTPTEKDITHIKVQFYLAGSTLNLIDEQVLPVIKDQEKSYTHTAYSWSSDGKDRFTTEYPNLNLLDGTRNFKPYGAGDNTPNQNAGDIYFTQNKTVTDLFKAGDYITVSYDVEFLNTDLYSSSEDVFMQIQMRGGNWLGISQVKAKNMNGKFYTRDTFKSSTYVENPTHKVTVSRTTQLTQDFITANATVNRVQSLYHYIPVGANIKLTNLKIEKADSLSSPATPWMPSESEVTIGDYPTFRGTETSNKYKSSQNPEDYEWIVFKGEDGVSPINVVILSSNGYQFKNGNISSILKAVLYQNNKEIDSDGKLYSYVWSKIGIDGKPDVAWNLAHSFSSKQLNITADDIWQKATFNCMVEPLN